jgi:hypothetical protein
MRFWGDMTIGDIARLFHETYERLAPRYSYKTRLETAVSWNELPPSNRDLMLAVTNEVMLRVDVESKTCAEKDKAEIAGLKAALAKSDMLYQTVKGQLDELREEAGKQLRMDQTLIAGYRQTIEALKAQVPEHLDEASREAREGRRRFPNLNEIERGEAPLGIHVAEHYTREIAARDREIRMLKFRLRAAGAHLTKLGGYR